MKKITLLFLLAGMIIISCTKDESVSEQKINQKTTVNQQETYESSPPCYTTVINAINEGSPYDKVGDWHNKALDHAATLVDVNDVEPNEMYDAIKDFFTNQEISQSFASFLENQNEPTNFLSEFHHENGLTLETFKNDYMNSNEEELIAIVADLNEIIFEDLSPSAQFKVNEIISYENNFISTYEGEEEIKFLSFFSILRHSLKYWTEANENSCHPYNQLVVSALNNSGARWISFELLLRLLVDVAVHSDCLSNGGLGATTLDQANDNCLPDAIYSSFRAFDGPQLK